MTGEPLVARGPYRFMRHPNYAVVVGEIAVAPMVLGLPSVALAYSIVHLGVLRVRIAAENRALESVPPRPSQEPAGRLVD